MFLSAPCPVLSSCAQVLVGALLGILVGFLYASTFVRVHVPI